MFCVMMLFADDTMIYFVGKNIKYIWKTDIEKVFKYLSNTSLVVGI